MLTIRMLTIRMAVAAVVLSVQASPSRAADDSPFTLTIKGSPVCLTPRCPVLRWTSSDRLLAPQLNRCLGALGSTAGSGVGLVDCDQTASLLRWECRNHTLLALKGQQLFIRRQGHGEPALSRDTGPGTHFTIQGTSLGACARTHREWFTLGGNAMGRPCAFPFLYQDTWYSDCTTFDSSSRRPWCAVETRYDNSQLYGYCPTKSTEHGWLTDPTTGVTSQINSQSALTWHQAKMSCEQQGASLLSITDPHEQSYILGALGSERHRMWMGLILDQEHGWQWADGRPFRYLKWDSGHPLPAPGNNCGVMDSAVQYSWQSSPCDRRLGYVCQKGRTTPAPAPVETGFCPHSWIPYNGHCFHLLRTKKAWSEAQQECRNEGGDLASIHTIEDQSFVISQLGYDASDELWIGLNDRRTEGLFDWDDQSTVTFTSWEFGKPRPSGSAEDCVLITGEKGSWADRVCTERHGFICMKTSASQPSGDEEELDVGCRSGWKRHGSSSYCYLVGTETKTFDEAKEVCRSSESYLADVSTGVDNAFLVSLVGMRPEKHFWLGLSNQRHMDYFVWTNTKHVTYTHWNAQMPGSSQGCVAMTTGVAAGLWDVLPCTDRVKYICKHLADGMVASAAPLTAAPPGCAEGWLPVPTRSYCYKFFTGPPSAEKTWFEARAYCRAIGGDLLSIHSGLELRRMGRGAAWIGLSIEETGSGWAWSDGTPVNFLHWVDGEPNNRWGVEGCAAMTLSLYDDAGSWNDLHCESYNDWLCQIRAGVIPSPPPNITADVTVTSDGWMEWQGSQYLVNPSRMGMDEARQFCQQRQGEIVVINSLAENTFLWKQISRSSYSESYYIGVRVELDGSYGWMDGSPMAYENWDENQPDFKNYDENCAVMTSTMGFWHDYNCGKDFKSICKRSGSPPVDATVKPTEPPKGGCPLDWSLFDSKCFRIIHQKKTWAEARRGCIGMAGNLVSIVSRRVQAYLIMSEALSLSKAATPTDLWIGLNSLRGGEYCWTDGRSRRYHNWNNKRRRSSGFYHMWREEHCVVMSSSPTTGVGRWVSTSCNDTNGYICLRDVEPQLPVPAVSTPDAYVKLGNDSFGVLTQNLTWKEAWKQCEENGAQLASLRTDWSQAYAELQASAGMGPLWIGLNKNETGGYFRFIDGWGLSISKWGRDEPRRGRPCVYIDVDGLWKTAFCNETMSSICMQSTDAPPTVSSKDPPGVCPEEVSGRLQETLAWVPFRGHCYLFIATEIEWADAASSCLRHGSHLASIEDPSEQSFLSGYVKMLADSTSSFWVGLCKTHKGQWFWLDKTTMDYSNWRDGGNTDLREYVAYGYIQSSDGQWATGQGWQDRAYICKTAKVVEGNVLQETAAREGEPRQRVHTAVAVVLVVLSALAVTALFLYRRSGRPLPTIVNTFDNPLFFEKERSQPDVVDTNKLIENAEEEEDKTSEPMITL